MGDTTYFISRADEYAARCAKAAATKRRLDNAIRWLQDHRSRFSAGVVLNVGAHVGTALIPLLQKGMFDKGLAVEPAPENAELLEKNLDANGLFDHVEVARVVIGDKSGQSVLYLSHTNSGNHTLCGDKLVWSPFRPKVSVPMTTIDELLVDYGVSPQDVNLVVMDIQGYEEQAMVGGRSLFSLSPPLVMELDHHYIDCQRKLSAICRSVEDHYRWFCDLDDELLTTHSITSLEAHFDTYSGYRDFVFY